MHSDSDWGLESCSRAFCIRELLRGQFNEMLEGILCGLCWPSMTLRVVSRGLDQMQDGEKYTVTF